MTKEEFNAAVRESNRLIGPIGAWLQANCSTPFVALVLIRLANRTLTDKVAIESGLDSAMIDKLFSFMTVEKEGLS